jgi:hypothetical protein
MDPESMRMLGNQRLAQFGRDADTARLMALPGSKRRREARIGEAVDQSFSAMLQCHWNQAERALSAIGHHGGATIADVAVSAVLSRLMGKSGTSGGRYAGLSLPVAADGLDSHTWAAATVAMALLDWCSEEPSQGPATARSDIAAAPSSTAIMHDMCTRAQTLGNAARDLLCLSLALHARTAGDTMMGSFLLGKLSSVITQLRGRARPESIARTASSAAPAAVGLCFLTVGDSETGRQILLAVADSSDTRRTPLVEGLIDAEMARVDHEIGNHSGAMMWTERTERFGKKYGCRLPAPG